MERNLYEQIEYLGNTLYQIQQGEKTLIEFGIRIIGKMETWSVPEGTYEYGDAFLIGTTHPYDIRVWTRNGTAPNVDGWVDLGEFPLRGPKGDTGSAGTNGVDGAPGVGVQSAVINQNGNLILTKTNGQTVNCGRAKGDTGATGQKGDKGDPGSPGTSIHIEGFYDTAQELKDAEGDPPPQGYDQSKGFAVGTQAPYNVYVLVGTYPTWEWTNLGIVESIPGPQGVGFNSLSGMEFNDSTAVVTYDTTDKAVIVSTSTMTFNDGTDPITVDSEMTIPVVPGDGIIIDANQSADALVIKVDDSREDTRYYQKTGNTKIPATDSSGDQTNLNYGSTATANSIAQRDNSGCVVTAYPTNTSSTSGQAVNIAYLQGYHDATKQDELSSGTGISISDNTVNNTGVLSVNGNTGAVTGIATSTDLQQGLATKMTTGAVSLHTAPITEAPTAQAITVEGMNYNLGGGGGSSYTFTNGLTESSGVVSWDLNDKIRAIGANGVTPTNVVIGNLGTAIGMYSGTNYNLIVGDINSQNFSSTTQKGSFTCGNAGSGNYFKNRSSGGMILGTAKYGSTIETGVNGGAEVCIGYATDGGRIHANGNSAVAIGLSYGSSYGGSEVEAVGETAVAIGKCVKAETENQFVIGKFNAIDNTNTTTTKQFIIGNGSDNTHRSNALSVTRSGVLQTNSLTDGTTTQSMTNVVSIAKCIDDFEATSPNEDEPYNIYIQKNSTGGYTFTFSH